MCSAHKCIHRSRQHQPKGDNPPANLMLRKPAPPSSIHTLKPHMTFLQCLSSPTAPCWVVRRGKPGSSPALYPGIGLEGQSAPPPDLLLEGGHPGLLLHLGHPVPPGTGILQLLCSDSPATPALPCCSPTPLTPEAPCALSTPPPPPPAASAIAATLLLPELSSRKCCANQL